MSRESALVRYALLASAIAASALVPPMDVPCGYVLAASGQSELSEQSTRSHPKSTGSSIQLFSAETAGRDELVTNLPYVAIATVTTIQSFSDNRIVNQSTQTVMRDSKGRIRREQIIGKIGSLQFKGPKLIFISDPSTDTEDILDPAQHIFRITKQAHASLADEANHVRSEERTGDGSHDTPKTTMRRHVSREDLGDQLMEHLSVEGKRITSTIPSGLFGNEKPFEISLETWYSSELHVYVSRKRIDPRVGETIYRLTDIRRVEPDPVLFQIPSGYKQISGSDAGPP